MAKEHGRETSSKSADKRLEERLAQLEARLAATEHTLELVRASRLGGELRAIGLGRRQREIDRDDARDREQERAGAAAGRAASFKLFAAERIVHHPDLTISRRLLKHAYTRWCRESHVPRLHWCESDSELAEAVTAALPEATADAIPSPGYLGRQAPDVPGFVSIALCEADETPGDAVSALCATADHAERERRARREDHQLAAQVEDAVLDTRRTRDDAARATVAAARE